MPEGTYTFNPDNIQLRSPIDQILGFFGSGTWPGREAIGRDSWGMQRVQLQPLDVETERTDFFIHGGSAPGSRGCIDLGTQNDIFFAALRSLEADNVTVQIQYPEDIGQYEIHPVLAGGWRPPNLNVDPGALTPFMVRPNCFLAGTPILMADGSEKSIEEVRAGDRVMSFDPTKDKGRGGLVPSEVARTFQNVTKTVIDLHGLKVTPGHRFLTGEGTFETIAEILRTDGTIITVDRGEVRARTNAKAGSPEDRPVRIVYREPASGRPRHIVARAGIPALFHADAPDRPLSTARFLQEAGIELLDNGMIREPGGRIVFCDWPEGATPLDLPLQCNFVVNLDGQPYVPEWIAGLSEEEDGLLEAVGDAGPRPSRSAPAPAGFRPTLAASNARPSNRRERRRAAALERVK